MLEGRAASRGGPPRDAPDKRASRRRKASARRPTMIDVANEARVSQTTVSLVLNHADGARLSPETRQRVMKAAAQARLSAGAAWRRGGLGSGHDRLRLR